MDKTLRELYHPIDIRNDSTTRWFDGFVAYWNVELYIDGRGTTYETYRIENMPCNFVQGTVSKTNKHCLRGLHGDFKTFKLLTILDGELFYVAVDIRKPSPTYLQWKGTHLYRDTQVYVCPGFAHGFYVTSDRPLILQYETSEYYDVLKQITIRYDEPKIGIEWPFVTTPPIISKRDSVTNLNGLLTL